MQKMPLCAICCIIQRVFALVMLMMLISPMLGILFRDIQQRCCYAVQVWSSGWGPEALAKLKEQERVNGESGMLGSWKVVLAGDFTGIPFTTLWRHRYPCWKFKMSYIVSYSPL